MIMAISVLDGIDQSIILVLLKQSKKADREKIRLKLRAEGYLSS